MSFLFFLNNWLFLDAQCKHEVVNNGREGEACLVGFPRLRVRKVLFSALWPPYSPFLGKSETKSREAIAGKEKGTGKLTLGDRGREPTQHERQRKKLECLGMAQWNTSTGRWKQKSETQTHAFASCHISKLIHDLPTPLKGAPRVLSRVIWLQIRLECRANCGLLYYPTSLSC